MKKRLLSMCMSLCMVIGLIGILPVMTASAHEISGDYKYVILDDGTVEISRYYGNESNVIVPSEINGRTVTAIGSINEYEDEFDFDLCGGNGNNYYHGAFERCKAESIVLPDTITRIDEYAFYHCDNLSIFVIPNGVTKIENCTFCWCEKLKNITIPNSVTSIGNNAFNDCESLASITIPGNVTNIGDYAFWNTPWLDSMMKVNPLVIVNGILIEGTACHDKSITIPNNVKKIAGGAFRYSTTLTNVTIPKSVTSIGDGAFYSCRYLKNVFYTGTQAQWKSIVIDKDNDLLKNATIHYNYDPDIVIPTVAGFKVSATSTNAVKLTCNKVSGATGYVFYRAVNGKWQRVGVSKTNSFYQGKLKSGTSYRYAVKAYKTVNCNNYYSSSYPTLWTSTNPAKVNLIVTSGSNMATLKWSKTTGATGYKVYYKASANGKWIGLTTTKGTSYTKAGLAKGKTYYFTVRAYRTVNGKTYNGAFVTKSVKVK